MLKYRIYYVFVSKIYLESTQKMGIAHIDIEMLKT